MADYQLPQGYSTRPVTLADVSDITRLTNLQEMAVEGKAEVTESRTRSILTTPDMDLESQGPQDSISVPGCMLCSRPRTMRRKYGRGRSYVHRH